jgi:ribosomal protein L28
LGLLVTQGSFESALRLHVSADALRNTEKGIEAIKQQARTRPHPKPRALPTLTRV